MAGAAAGACAPALGLLPGVPAPARFPNAMLPAGHHLVVFRWELKDGDLVARGDGAARLASPDSGRLDFFLSGGLGSGAAVLIGDESRIPGPGFVQHLVPAAPLLWAAFGRLALPSLPDTVARIEGAVLRADVGTPIAWRVTFEDGRLRRVEQVSGGRVQEWVEMTSDGHVRYRNERDRRSLDLVITRTDEVPPFDPALWTIP